MTTNEKEKYYEYMDNYNFYNKIHNRNKPTAKELCKMS